MTIVSREETQLDWLGVESLSLESLSVESLCVLGGEMASRRRCSAFTCDTCWRSEETSASTLEICTLASTKVALIGGETFKSGWASDVVIAGGRSASDRATDAMHGGGRDSGPAIGPPSDPMLCA